MRLGVGCPCPPVCNKLVTLYHLFQWLFCPTVGSSIREILKHCKKRAENILFWVAAPKAVLLNTGVGGISRHPSFRLSFSPPLGHQDHKFAFPALNLALQASNRPSKLHISPPQPISCGPFLSSGPQGGDDLYAFTQGNFLFLLLLLLLPPPPTSRPLSQPQGSYPNLKVEA